MPPQNDNVRFLNQPTRGLVGDGGGPHDPGMEARIARLEDSMTTARERLVAIETQLTHVATKAWIMGGVIVVLLTILGGCWWLAQEYLSPILQATGG